MYPQRIDRLKTLIHHIEAFRLRREGDLITKLSLYQQLESSHYPEP